MSSTKKHKPKAKKSLQWIVIPNRSLKILGFAGRSGSENWIVLHEANITVVGDQP